MKTNPNIYMTKRVYDHLIHHCQRKLDEQYLDGESKERKAYGLIGGVFIDSDIHIKEISPLLKNNRKIGEEKKYIDDVLSQFGIPSETKFDNRAWVANPNETISIINHYSDKNIEMIGNYHMHRVAWDHDPVRDTPTELDTELAKDTGQYQFIVSMVDRENPILRVYYEGHPDKEAKVIFTDE